MTYTQNLLTAGWLPARTRARLTRDITRRNALDRARMAEAGITDPTDTRGARFQGPGAHDALDRAVRKAVRG